MRHGHRVLDSEEITRADRMILVVRAWKNMSYVLAEVSGARDRSKALVFVRGFQGYNYLVGKSTHQTRWYRSLRDWGYTGRILTFRWHSPSSDCLSHLEKCYAPWRSNWLYASPSERIEEAADVLCELLLRLKDVTPETSSLLGFSMGGWIIARALRTARRRGMQVKRAYLFGAAAPRTSRWPELIECVSDGLWNFHSAVDNVLLKFCPNSVGLYGLPAYYDGARDVDCTSLVDRHDQWAYSIEGCLRRARLRPSHL